MSPVKYISVHQSDLYRLGTKRDLASALNTDLSSLKTLKSDENYREWTKPSSSGKKDRVIEEPTPPLETVLNRLHFFLSRVETPSWLMSGKKRIRPQDNAALHTSHPFMITVDIAQFYQSTKREYIYLSFRNEFGQSDDVASLIADLSTYKGHIPTGAAPSQLLAFWAYKQTFERIHSLASRHGITMSVWVDDITFSSSRPFPKNWVRNIENIAREVGLSLKTNKTRYYFPRNFKSVTGSAITPNGHLTVQNKKREEIVELMHGKRIEALPIKEARSLFGKISAQRQNDSEFFSVVFVRLKRHLRTLERQSRKSA